MPTLINICGTRWSGTTMLNLMLGNGADAFACGEIAAWFHPFRRHHKQLSCRCGKDPCPVWEMLRDLPAKAIHARISERTGRPFIIDSSKAQYWIVDSVRWASAEGMPTLAIALWRDPLYMCYGRWRRGMEIMEWRTSFLHYHRRLLSLGIPVCSLQLEDLRNDPAGALKAVCRASGLRWFAGKERYWEGEHHYLFGNVGVRRDQEAGGGKVFPPESMDKSFTPLSDRLRETLARDSELQEIIGELRSHDVLSPVPNAVRAAIAPVRPRPAWYYVHRGRLMWRRFVPENYPLEAADREVFGGRA